MKNSFRTAVRCIITFSLLFSFLLLSLSLTLSDLAANADSGGWVRTTLPSGVDIDVWLVNQEPQDNEMIIDTISKLDSEKLTNGFASNDPLQVVVITSSGLNSITEEDKAILQNMSNDGIPIISESAEIDLAEVLDFRPIDLRPSENIEFFVFRKVLGVMRRTSFTFTTPVNPVVTNTEYSNGTETDSSVTEFPQEVEATPEILKAIRSSLIEIALNWVLAKDTRETDAKVSLVDKEVLASGAVDTGSWTSIPDLRREWVQTSPEYWKTSGWDFSKAACTFKTTADFYKIPDEIVDRDFYLVQLKVHHQANDKVSYISSVDWCDSGWVGWYIRDRTAKISATDEETELRDYGPTGTLSQQTVSISVGASLGVTPGGPSTTINANFQTFYTNSDATVMDQSSYTDDYGQWKETFIGPNYNPSYCWDFRDPSAVARGSFQSEKVAIFSTDNVYSGVNIWIEDSKWACKDAITWYFCGPIPWCEGVFTKEVFAYNCYYPAWVQAYWNYAPSPPGKPSIPTPLWVNDDITISVPPAVDRDGDTVSYGFDFGDGTPVAFGADGLTSRVHTWSVPGYVTVRAKAKDMRGTESVWSDSTNVIIKGLDWIGIQGPIMVNENSLAQLDCMAYFSDGSSRPITNDGWEGGSIVWDIDTTKYAEISEEGLFTAKDGDGQNRQVQVIASYTIHGITKTDTHLITVVDTDYDADCLPNDIDPCPLDADCDDDGIPDGTCSPGEDKNNNGIVDPGESDPTNPDTDGDGILDGTEIGLAEPVRPEYTDMSVFIPDLDPSTQTNPLDYDSDNDGLSDGEEDKNHNGKVDILEPDPNNPDTDGDGIPDGIDTSPLVPGSGFSTGGGWFYWPEDGSDLAGAKTNFGFNVKYNEKTAKFQGSLLIDAHVKDGVVHSIKSNLLDNMAIGNADGYSWAWFSGKCTYKEWDWTESIGNYQFLVYVEDWDEPGKGVDQFWIEVIEGFSMDKPVLGNTETIYGGNVAVHTGMK